MNIDSGFTGGSGGGNKRKGNSSKKGGKKKSYSNKKKGRSGGGSSNGSNQGNTSNSGSPFGTGGAFGGTTWGTTSTASAPFGGTSSSGSGGRTSGRSNQGGGGGGRATMNEVLARVGVNAVTQSPELQVLLVKTKESYCLLGGAMHRGQEDDVTHLTNEIAHSLAVPAGQTAGVPPVVPIGSTQHRSNTYNVYLIRGQQGWEQWMPTKKNPGFTGQVFVNGKQAAVSGGVLWANWADFIEECRFSFCSDGSNRKKCCSCSSTTCSKVHVDFNRYSSSGSHSSPFGGGGGRGNGNDKRLNIFFATTDWFVRYGEQYLKKYQEKIENMAKEALFRFCQAAFKPQTVLHEDDEIQVSIRRGDAAFPRAVMDVAFLNKTNGQRHFAVELKVPSSNVTGGASGQVPALLPPNTPAVQALQFEARGWFGSQEIPGLLIQHAAADNAGGAHSLRMVDVKVPFLVSSFLQPAPINAAAWNELAASEKKREFRIPPERMTNINLLLQTALHMQVEMNGNCITAAGCVADPKNLCLVVIEFQNGIYLMSVRSSIAHICDVLINLFSFLDFCSPTELMQ